MTGLVAISRYFDPDEAYVARSFLEANGVTVLVQNDQHGRVAPQMRIALGGFALLTPQSEASTARELLRAASRGETALTDEGAYLRMCERCGHAGIRRTPGLIWKAFSILYWLWWTAIPFVPGPRRARCPNCGASNAPGRRPWEPDGFSLQES